MRVVVQRVKEGNVVIDGKVHGEIGAGYVLLVGFTHGDTAETAAKVAKKITELRIFDDENGKMNLSIYDAEGAILSISQFTLYADVSQGRRPSFTTAMNYRDASALYDVFNNELRKRNLRVETGIFGAEMKVSLVNDGPVTIWVDSKEL
ncbi:MAG: D-tyrosyl-tRNA(Tyr) deacylase [Erysipelotrichales bacterium]|nr:D-tyrosyl-tRNA(Tyr) deacylase [Erysipelotrichales bacterium]